MPEISVIVPVYKVEPYLRRCVDSILSQTFADFELILVDDGSPDNCGAICDEYAQKDSRVRVIHKENGGVSSARNAGLDIANGTYVTFCDSDDYYTVEWLENLLVAITSNQADVIVGNFKMMSSDEKELQSIQHEVATYQTESFEGKKQYVYSQLFGNKNGWEVWSRLFKMQIVKDKNVRFCESCGNYAEDLGFVLEYMLFANKVVSIEFSGYRYRVRPESMMQSSVGVYKFDNVSEVALHFLHKCELVFKDEIERKGPVFFFLIMFSEYRKIVGSEKYKVLKYELLKIQQYGRWREYTKQIFRCKKELRDYFGQFNARRILLLSHYCLHGNWNRFKIESGLFYRLNKAE